MKPLATSNISAIPNNVEPHLWPIFQPGRHTTPLTALYNHAVKNFPSSKRRPVIWRGLLSFLDELAAWEITGEIWIDGSFCTHKNEPKDVDLVILIERASLLAKSKEERLKLRDWLTAREYLRKRFHCDVYFIDSGKQSRRDYWENWYGFCKDRATPKGIAVIRINDE